MLTRHCSPPISSAVVSGSPLDRAGSTASSSLEYAFRADYNHMTLGRHSAPSVGHRYMRVERSWTTCSRSVCVCSSEDAVPQRSTARMQSQLLTHGSVSCASLPRLAVQSPAAPLHRHPRAGLGLPICHCNAAFVSSAKRSLSANVSPVKPQSEIAGSTTSSDLPVTAVLTPT